MQQLVNFYNLTVNNSFNFKGYQCDFSMLPITVYNENEKILLYKEGATLGITKLEYIVSTGIKQINLESKITLENYLKLDQLKPLSVSYTQNDNSKQKDDTITTEQENKDTNNNEIKEQEVNNSEEDTE